MAPRRARTGPPARPHASGGLGQHPQRDRQRDGRWLASSGPAGRRRRCRRRGILRGHAAASVTTREPTGATRCTARRAAGPTPEPVAPEPLTPARPRPRRDRRRSCREMLKFGVVGAVAFVVDVGVFNLLRFGFGEGTPAGQPLRGQDHLGDPSPHSSRGWATATGPSGTAGSRQAHHELLLFVGVQRASAWLIAVACLGVSHYVLGPAQPAGRQHQRQRSSGWCSARCSGSGPTAGSSSPARSSPPTETPADPHLTSAGQRSRPPPRTGRARRSPAVAWTSSSRPPLDSARSRASARPRPVLPALLTVRSKICGADRRRHAVALVADLDDDRAGRCGGRARRPCRGRGPGVFSSSVDSTWDSATGVA